MNRKTIIIFFNVLICFIANNTFGQSCKELITYRDVQLPKALDNAVQKYALMEGAKIDYIKIKQDILDDTKWTASEWSLLTGLIASNFKTTADLINDLLKFTPSGQVVGTTQSIADDVYTTIKLGKDLNSLFKNGAERYVAEKIISKAGKVGQAITASKNLAANISVMTEIPSDHSQLKLDVKAAIENIEREMSELQISISSNANRIAEINNYKEGIDKYLSEQCGTILYNSTPFNTGYLIYPSTNPNCSLKTRLLNVRIEAKYDRMAEKFIYFKVLFTREGTTTHTCSSVTNPKPTHSQEYVLNTQNITNNQIIINLSPKATYPTKYRSVSFSGNIQTTGLIIGKISIAGKSYTVNQDIQLNKQ